MKLNLSPYRKTIAAITTSLIGWASAVVVSPEARITAPEWIMLVAALATALGVYSVRNEPAAALNVSKPE